MFIEISVADCVRLPAACLHDEIIGPIHMALQQKFSNRVIRDQGLCIAIRHISHIDDPLLYATDSGIFIRVRFSLIVFRPFLYEILVGTVRHSDPSGVLISFGFTEDVFIHHDQLPDLSLFDEEEQLWYWKYLDNQMYIDIGEPIRFRVVEIQYGVDGSASQPLSTGVSQDSSKPNSAPLMADLRPAMLVLGSIAEDGLGLVKWWQQQDDDDNIDNDDEQLQQEQLMEEDDINTYHQ